MLQDQSYVCGIQRKTVSARLFHLSQKSWEEFLWLFQNMCMAWCFKLLQAILGYEDLFFKPQETWKSSPKASKEIKYMLSKHQSKEGKKKQLQVCGSQEIYFPNVTDSTRVLRCCRDGEQPKTLKLLALTGKHGFITEFPGCVSQLPAEAQQN